MFFDFRLWQFTKGVRLRIAGAVMIGLLATAFGVARLALLGWLLAKVFRGEPLDAMIMPFTAVAGVMLLRGGLEYWRNMVAHRTAARVQRHLRKRLYDKVIELGPAHFGLQRTGDVMLSMIDGVEQLETYFGQYLPQIFVALFTPVAIFAFVAFLDFPVAVLLVAFALITLIAPSAFQRWNRESSRFRQRSYGDFSAEFLDSVQGLVTLKAFGQSEARARLLADKARALFRSTMWLLAASSASRGITDAGITVGAAATIGFGAYRVNSGVMELEVLLMVLMMGTEVFRPLRDLRSLIHQGMVGQAAARAVYSIMDAAPPVEPQATGEVVHGDLSPTVKIENVRFAYPGGRRAVHRGLSIRAAAGERVGVVGPSGAGKSSIVRLLLRIYDPQEGSIRLGGRDIKELGLDQIRAQLAIVNQDTYLFHGTVEDNLRFGKPEATGEELEAAARAANAHDFITRLPRGYHTVVGERGIRLSGGQRQRITIARALLRDAPILVLDEALSSVDAENEVVIQEALDRLMRGRTTIIFAHRLSSVINADRILVLEDGHVVESGTHGKLMAERGPYWRLMAGQAQDGAASALPPGCDVGDRPAPEGPEPAAYDHAAQMDPTDSILRAEGMGWLSAIAALLRLVASRKVRLMLAFLLGVVRVLAFIGVGVLSALMVAAVKAGTPFYAYLLALSLVAPLAGVLHWLESWVAHDMAYRLLAEMRIALFNKLDRLAPAYLARRRTGDLVAMVTQDVEAVEYFFAHTVAPAFVAGLVPGAVLATLFAFGWPMALALIPFLAAVTLSPFLMRRRVDEFASRAREALGELNAHVVDTIQGLNEIVAFQQAARCGVRSAGPRPPSGALAVLQGFGLTDGDAGGRDRPWRAYGYHRRGASRRRRRSRQRHPAVADLVGDGGVPATVRDRQYWPATGGYAGGNAAASCGARRKSAYYRWRGSARGGARRGGVARDSRRRFRLLWRRPVGALGGELFRAGGPHSGCGRPFGRRQDDGRPFVHAFFRPRARCGAHERS